MFKTCFLIAAIHLEFVTSIHSNRFYSKIDKLKQITDTREKIRSGIGGTTIVEYLNEGKTFLIRDQILYNCTGTIANGQCFGTLTQFNADENIIDFCYANHRIIIDNKICLSIVPITVYERNNVTKCEGTPNRTIFIPMEKFRQKCGDSWLIRYKYTPNHSDFITIPFYDCENFHSNHECILTINETI